MMFICMFHDVYITQGVLNIKAWRLSAQSLTSTLFFWSFCCLASHIGCFSGAYLRQIKKN